MILNVFHLAQYCCNFHARVGKGSYNLGVVAVQKQVVRSAIAADLQIGEKLEQKTHMERSAAANRRFRTGGD